MGGNGDSLYLEEGQVPSVIPSDIQVPSREHKGYSGTLSSSMKFDHCTNDVPPSLILIIIGG
eukprot:scaffold166250_cov39-Attheya_sp.AAC.1